MDSPINETKRSAPIRWLVSGVVLVTVMAMTASAWAQAGQQSCPCPGQQGFLTGTAGYAVRWLLIIALFIITAVAAFALGRSRKRAEQA